MNKSLWPSLLNYGLDEPHGWRAKKALKQISFNDFAQCITLRRELSVPQQQEPISPSSNISLSNHVLTPCHGQGDCPCHSCHGQGGHPRLPSHSSGGQVIRDFLADSASHLDQGDCSSDLCLQDHFLRMHGICYSPKDSCHPFLFPAATIYPLRPPVAAVNPLLRPIMTFLLPPSLVVTSVPLQSLVATINLLLSVTALEPPVSAPAPEQYYQALLPPIYTSAPFVLSCVNVCFV